MLGIDRSALASATQQRKQNAHAEHGDHELEPSLRGGSARRKPQQDGAQQPGDRVRNAVRAMRIEIFAEPQGPRRRQRAAEIAMPIKPRNRPR